MVGVCVGVSVGVIVGVCVGVSVGVIVGVFVGVSVGVIVGVIVVVGVIVGVILGVGEMKLSNGAAHLSSGVITIIFNTPFQPPHKSLYFSIKGIHSTLSSK